MKLQDGWSRWEKPGDVATHPQGIYNNGTNSNKASSRFLEDGSYLKLRNLTIGYNLALPQFYISNLRIFASGEIYLRLQITLELILRFHPQTERSQGLRRLFIRLPVSLCLALM